MNTANKKTADYKGWEFDFLTVFFLLFLYVPHDHYFSKAALQRWRLSINRADTSRSTLNLNVEPTIWALPLTNLFYAQKPRQLLYVSQKGLKFLSHIHMNIL